MTANTRDSYLHPMMRAYKWQNISRISSLLSLAKRQFSYKQQMVQIQIEVEDDFVARWGPRSSADYDLPSAV